jgi:branched-chain amino acid transport system ATP-binding protein
MLKLDHIHTFYGKSHVLNGVCLEIDESSGIALSGRNGVGKTTTIRSIIGFTPPRQGAVTFEGVDITGLPPHRIARMGMALVPQGRRIFNSLTIGENLLVAGYKTDKPSKNRNLEKVFLLFPILKERFGLRARALSGGEMQMLAIARALMAAPRLLLMDEPTEGLAPLYIEEIKRIILAIKAEKKTSILLVEQNFQFVLETADYIYVMNKGQVVYESTPGELENNEEIKARHLGLGSGVRMDSGAEGTGA